MKHISIHEFGEQVSALLPKLIRHIYQYEIQVIARGELTVSKLQFLDCLAEQKSPTMKDLAEYANLKRPSATAVADQMIAQGLISRKPGEKDRRTVFVNLTEKGRRLHKAIQTERKKGLVNAFKTISAAERTAYLNIIQKLSLNILENKHSNKTAET